MWIDFRWGHILLIYTLSRIVEGHRILEVRTLTFNLFNLGSNLLNIAHLGSNLLNGHIVVGKKYGHHWIMGCEGKSIT